LAITWSEVELRAVLTEELPGPFEVFHRLGDVAPLLGERGQPPQAATGLDRAALAVGPLQDGTVQLLRLLKLTGPQGKVCMNAWGSPGTEWGHPDPLQSIEPPMSCLRS
jgi:hypothetical protein